MENITVEQVIALLPKKVTLHWVGRNDSLDNHTQLIQKCISKGSLDELYTQIDEWFINDYYGFDAVVDELKNDIENTFNLSEDEVGKLYNKYEDEVRDAIYERDDSDVIEDLFRNTSPYVFFYDTGHYVECVFPCGKETIEEQLAEIKKIIKLETNDYDGLIRNMMYQAAYGGNLVIYFSESGLDILKSIQEGCNVVSFSGEVNIAIPNHSCGAGDHTSFRHSFSLPFSKDNLFLCKEVKYSYTYEVCGMSSSWCDSTEMTLSKSEEDLGEVVISDTAAHVAREAELDAVYASGGCTAGDMRYERHRNMRYRNNYPCGSICEKCGTFFID